MTETAPPSEPPVPHHACTCGGLPRQHGPRARSSMAEWRDPEVLEKVQAMGKRVRWIREQLDIRQDALSELSGVSKGVIGDIEKGKPKDVAYLIVLARALRVPFYKLWWPEKKWAGWATAAEKFFEEARKKRAKEAMTE